MGAEKGAWQSARPQHKLNRLGCTLKNLPWTAHRVALHFSPASVGQEPCVDAGSSSPLGFKLGGGGWMGCRAGRSRGVRREAGGQGSASWVRSQHSGDASRSLEPGKRRTAAQTSLRHHPSYSPPLPPTRPTAHL